MTNAISSLMLKLTYAIENYGVVTVMGKLDEMNSDLENNVETKFERFIIETCCKHYSVPVDSVVTNNTIRGTALIARNMSFVLMKKHLGGYSYLQIAKACKKNTSNSVQRALDEFNAMNPKLKHEREFLEAYEILNTKIKNDKSKLFTNQ